SGEELARFGGHTGEVTSVAVTPSGLELLSASDDRTVRLWEIASRAEIRVFTPHTRGVTALAFMDEKTVISGAWDSGSWDGALRLWGIETGEIVRSFYGLSDSISALASSGDSSRLVSGCWDGTLKVWEWNSSQELLTYSGHGDWITAVAITPDGRHVVSTSHD